MEDQYLQDQLKKIEKNNQINFDDPFFQLHSIMNDFLKKYFNDYNLDGNIELTNVLIVHLDEIMETLDDISYKYSEAEAEYYKWRLNSFVRVFYKALSKEANTIASMLLQLLQEYDEMCQRLLGYDDMIELKKMYSSIVNRVYLSSRRVSDYHLENLWQ
jgi:hypothetical protein